jgi:hypothetical protein
VIWLCIWKDNTDNGQGFRITTIKLRGQLSQGLLLPLSGFPELANYSVDADITEILNVKK